MKLHAGLLSEVEDLQVKNPVACKVSDHTKISAEICLEIYFENKSVGIGDSSPDSEANHSPPHTADVKNKWSYTSVPLYAFTA